MIISTVSKDALSAAEQAGLRTFIAIGCADCHSGVGVGGAEFEKFGVKKDYWTATGSKQIDKGRYDVTKKDEELYVFKVPILRNVEMSPPYFHDGSVNDLREAVRIMAQVQLGSELSDNATQAIIAFLKGLTGKLPENFTKSPVLPPSAFGLERQKPDGSAKK